MNSIDMLRQKRESNYGEKPGASGPVDANRSIALSDEEKQMVGEGHEGPVTLMVTGTVGEDGKFMIESVSPAGGHEEEKPIPVQMQTQPSPS